MSIATPRGPQPAAGSASWVAILIAVVFSAPAPAGGGAGISPASRDLTQKGNAFYAAGEYAQALKAYEEAAAQLADTAPLELTHNRAAAYFKLGQIDEARELWARVKTLGDPAFEARTRYNLGNCDYADALTLSQQPDQAAGAMALLDQAAAQYQEALRLDPTFGDARANLELTQLLKKQIQEQQSQSPQGQPQACSQPSESAATQPADQSQQPDQQGQSQGQQSQTQPSQPQAPESQPTEQPQAQEDRQESQPQDETPQEQQPTTMPAASQPAPAEAEPAAEGEEQEQPPVTIHLTPEQAERLLQMVRDAEKARREMLARRRMATQKPVERDW